MGQIQKEHHGAKIRRPLPAIDGGKQAWDSLGSTGQKFQKEARMLQSGRARMSTLRAEEVNTSKALIDVNHIEPERWILPLIDADWYAGIEGKDWE